MRELLDAELDVVGGGKRKHHHHKAGISVEDVNANVAVVTQTTKLYVGDDLTIKAHKGSTVFIGNASYIDQDIAD